MAILSYVGRVHIAVRIVEGLYPGATLHEVNGSAPDGALTTDPKAITMLRCVFRNTGGSSIFINSGKTWGTWEEPTLVTHPWIEDQVVPWPIDLDLDDACRLLAAAGFTEPFKSFTLRWPTAHPMPTEPAYTFAFGEGRFAFVGVNSHEVHQDMSV